MFVQQRKLPGRWRDAVTEHHHREAKTGCVTADYRESSGSRRPPLSKYASLWGPVFTRE